MEETKKKLELIKSQLSYKMIIPEPVERKIRILCREIPNVEWSGVLFYKVKGTFEDSSLVIECVDIFQMDVGSSAYTEYNMSADVMNYMVQHPELINEDIFQGLIHSHNKMATFFSGTDTSTLLAEGSDMNHFVSLIVNNAGKYTAAVTRRITVSQEVNEEYSYQSWKDAAKEGTRKFTVNKEFIQYFNLNIEVESSINEDEILERITELNEAKKKKSVVYQTPSSYQGYGYDYQRYPSFEEYKKQETKKEEKKEEVKTPSLFNDDFDDLPSDVPYDKYHYEKELVDTLVKQLITGSIVLTNASAIDIKKWCESMETILDERFKDLKDYENYMVNVVDFIIVSTEDPEIEMYVPRFSTAILANDIKEALSKLPNNKYIRTLIDICEDYIF